MFFQSYDVYSSTFHDYLVIESTGIAEPLPVAQTFVMDVNTEEMPHDHDHDHDHDHEHNPEEPVFEPLSKFSRMDTLVTVLDTFNFFKILREVETHADRLSFLGPDEQDEESEPTVVQLLIDQIEFANVILLNKIDLLKEGDRESMIEEIKNLVARLNPKAKVIIPENPRFEGFPVDNVLNTNLFDMDEAETSAGWLAELEKPEHNPETEEYGISSIVFKETLRPFHPKRLHEITRGFGQLKVVVNSKRDDLEQNDDSGQNDSGQNEHKSLFAGVVRSKGQIWLANADACPIDLHSAGRQLELIPLIEQPWCGKIVDLHPNGDPDLPNSVEEDCDIWETFGTKEGIESFKSEGDWTEEFGDRGSQLVCIGMQMNKEKLMAALNGALLTDEEMADKESWKTFENPFFNQRVWSVEDLLQWVDGEEDEDAEFSVAQSSTRVG